MVYCFFRKVCKIKDYDFFKKKKMNLLIKVNMFSLVSVSKSESRLDHRKALCFSSKHNERITVYTDLKQQFCNFTIPFDPSPLWTALHKKWSFSWRIWPHFLKKSLKENFLFCAVLYLGKQSLKENFLFCAVLYLGKQYLAEKINVTHALVIVNNICLYGEVGSPLKYISSVNEHEQNDMGWESLYAKIYDSLPMAVVQVSLLLTLNIFHTFF